MEFIRKLFGKSDRAKTDVVRGAAPVQSQDEQDATRSRMESEMAAQKERRESGQTKE